MAITVSGFAGVFCDPAHVIVYPESGQARQQHVTLVHAVPDPSGTRIAGPRPDHDETDAARWVDVDDLATLSIHPSVHRRLDLALRHHRGQTPTYVE